MMKYFIPRPKLKFISLKVDDGSSKLLRKWCKNYGFNLGVDHDENPQPENEFYFHLTVFYTNNEVVLRNGIFELDPIPISLSGMELLGEDKDIPVLKVVKTKSIQDIRDHFESLGLTDEWPEWKPHITVSYERKHYDLSGIELPRFPIIINELKIKNQE